MRTTEVLGFFSLTFNGCGGYHDSHTILLYVYASIKNLGLYIIPFVENACLLFQITKLLYLSQIEIC
jgi:hypothetical protein